MTDKELRKLSRKDLLELLLVQRKEMDALQEKLEEVQEILRDRQIRIEKAGSLAEAALQINRVFEAAEAAAQQYMDNIRQRSEQIEAVCSNRERACVQREKESQEKIDCEIREALRKAQSIVKEAERKSIALEKEAKEKAEAYWREASRESMGR